MGSKFLCLQAFSQVPDLRVWYGPDTYMGRNLAQLFTSMADMSDEEIAEIHPAHSQVQHQILPKWDICIRVLP